MSKLTSDERARTGGTSFDPHYVPPSDGIQVFKNGEFQPMPGQDPPQRAPRAACMCATCNSGRNKAYAAYSVEIDALIAVLVHGSEQEKQQVHKMLKLEQEGN